MREKNIEKTNKKNKKHKQKVLIEKIKKKQNREGNRILSNIEPSINGKARASKHVQARTCVHARTIPGPYHNSGGFDVHSQSIFVAIWVCSGKNSSHRFLVGRIFPATNLYRYKRICGIHQSERADMPQCKFGSGKNSFHLKERVKCFVVNL